VTVRSLEQFLNTVVDRGSSDYDVRQIFSGAIMADLPSWPSSWSAPLLRNWSVNSIVFARSALPTHLLSSNSFTRPDVVPGQPLYLYDHAYPGGKRYNDSAFADPQPDLEGNLGRNVLRGFGAWQVDMALIRVFRLSGRTALQFRAEAFNLFNHPNFANPSDTGAPFHLTLRHAPDFGLSSMMLATGLAPLGVPGQLDPVFQMGSPRSLQFGLRLSF
jgi:hypothetical protein